MLATLGELDAQLTELAQGALADADAATTLDERRRYERLYGETSTRLGELRAVRRDLQRQLEQLEGRPLEADDDG